jgi:hypothetical protein
MKRISLKLALLMSLIVILTTPSVSTAQTQFGVRGGLNAANISFNKLPNKSERFGFHVGVFADIPVMPNFMSIQPELDYSVQGAAFKPTTDRKTLSMNYVNLLIPVAFKLSEFDLQVGPFASFLISKADYTVYSDNKLVVDAFKKLDIGLTAGLAYNFNKKMLVGLKYNQGFMDVTKDISRPLLGSGKNSVGQISFGYKF